MSKSKGFATGHNESVGKGSRAGLPEDVQFRDYPKDRYYPDSDLDDTMTGIDKINSATSSRASKYKSNQK